MRIFKKNVLVMLHVSLHLKLYHCTSCILMFNLKLHAYMNYYHNKINSLYEIIIAYSLNI